MKKKSASKSAFFNLRVLIGLCIALVGVLLALLGFGTFSNASAQANVGSTTLVGQSQDPKAHQVGQTTVIPALHNDLSRPLRDQPVEWPQLLQEHEANLNPKIPIKHKDGADPVIQSSFWQPLIMTPAISPPIRQWAGIGKPCNGCGTVPPDTTGAVGKTQYVELVNMALQVFDKVEGKSLLGPIPIASVWKGFGGACETGGRGDPVVIYDRLADRWVISQFARPSGVNSEQDECIAISQTGDATGAWYRYDFHLTIQFQDYPKLGVWPDGYYMSAFIFFWPRLRYLGPQPFVFDRAKMLVGDPNATGQTPEIIGGTNEQTFLPSDLDGILPPPAGGPNHFVAFPQEENAPPPREAQSDALNVMAQSSLSSPTPAPLIHKVWAYHVDWNQPANSTFTREASVPSSPFTALCPSLAPPRCVPQLGASQENWLDGLGDRLMFRNAYRRFPDGHESLLNNFTVGANSVAGIRWFELQRALPGKWTLHQESTYQPDSTWRWMGSIASDNQGNIALGFSASSNTIYPQIRYAGRLATDRLNVLSDEQHLFDGTGDQIGSENRWGDYSDMTVDPVDDCTFYYASEYYKVKGEQTWRTRIGYFRFPQCTPPQKGTGHFVVTTCNVEGLKIGNRFSAPVRNALVSIDGRLYGATLSDGIYDAVLAPGSHSYVVSDPFHLPQRGNFAITNGQTTVVGLCLRALSLQ